MSLILEGVRKTFRSGGKEQVLFDDLWLEVHPGERVAILGLAKSGKTTLLEIICGTKPIDAGYIERGLRPSWPIPMSDFIAPRSSVAWNIRWVARLLGVRDRDFTRFAAKLGDLEPYLDTRVGDCPRFVKQQLAFAIGLAADFDLYLFDGQLVPPRKEFKDLGMAVLEERTEGKAVLIVTAQPKALPENFDRAYVLEEGRATPFDSLDEAGEHFKALKEAEAERQSAEGRRADEMGGPDSILEESFTTTDQAAAIASDF